MALFAKPDAATAYLKMGIFGEAASGKTFTASQVAKGLALLIGSKAGKTPPVTFLDTETGATWVRSIFDKAGVEFLVYSSRSFADLKQAVAEAEAAGAILIVDSITHFWEEIREAYLAAKRKRLRNEHARIELPDWNIIKTEWARFTSLYLNSKCHIILCGRAGNVYEFQENEETHKKEMITAGTRMAAEKGLGYEPNLLVEMTARQVVGPRNKSKTLVRAATVLKDRSDILDGLVFEDPTFENFLPHIERLNLGGKHSGVDTSRTSEDLFPTEGEARDIRVARRKVALGDIQDLLVLHIPGQGAADKQRKVALLRKHFNAGWTELEELMSLERLQEGFRKLKAELEPPSQPPPTPECVQDEIPHTEPKAAAVAEPKADAAPAAPADGAQPDDRDTIAGDLIAKLRSVAGDKDKVEAAFAAGRGEFESLDEPRQAKVRAAYDEALKGKARKAA
jgi:hypothetical protein